MTMIKLTTHARQLAITLFTPICLMAPLAAQAQAGWEGCAYEGQVCRVPGPATVRYGTEGAYSYRNVNGPVRCSNDLFGDPAREVAKQCAFRLGHNQSPDDRHPGNWNGGWTGNNAQNERGWEKCADENRYCGFQGTREVRFGAGGRYAVRTITGGTDCNVRNFGDPAPGTKKTCQVREGSDWGGGYNRPPVSTDNGNWHFCSDEKDYCRPPRGATVRFGANGRYTYMNRVQGEIACNVQTFGEPIYGERKRCEYSTNSGNLGGNWNKRGWESGN
jgi:hypothetical protein